MTAPRKRPAITIVEMLIALAIVAMLITGVAAAIHASLSSYTNNEKISSITQAARSVLHRISRDIRTASAISATSTELIIIPPDDGSGLQEIRYDYTDSTLNYTRNVSGVVTSHVLLGADEEIKATAFNVTHQTGLDWQGTTCTKSVTIHMDLTVAGRTLSLTTTAAPRRNQLY